MIVEPMSIQWLNQFAFDNALQRSRQIGRPVLLDFHDPRCACCQRLERSTYSDPTVISAITDYVVPLRVVTAEPDDVSAAIILRYLCISTPTIQLISPEGTVYHCWRGAPRQTTLSARQYQTSPPRGYRRVYHEATGSLSPALFLAQLLIGRGKTALKHELFDEAVKLFQEVIAEYGNDEAAVKESRYWLAIACSNASSCAISSGGM